MKILFARGNKRIGEKGEEAKQLACEQTELAMTRPMNIFMYGLNLRLEEPQEKGTGTLDSG